MILAEVRYQLAAPDGGITANRAFVRLIYGMLLGVANKISFKSRVVSANVARISLDQLLRRKKIRTNSDET